MVATRSWLSDIKRSFASDTKKNNKTKQQTFSILAFETARTMSHLVSLYKSLSDEELNKLGFKIMKSEGVTYLNSEDEGFLLNLASAEHIEDLDHCANAVARLGKKCSDPALYNFEDVYADLKFGFIDINKMDFFSKEVVKNIEKMEKLISATSSLYSSLEALSELELSDQKLIQWKHTTGQKVNSDLVDDKLGGQRQLVKHYKEVSLWSKTFDKTIALMARIICIIYARICVVFGPCIPHKSVQPPQTCSKSGPIGKPSKRTLIRFWSRGYNQISDVGIATGLDYDIGFNEKHKYLSNYKIIQAAPPSTLGGCGLALRYANVITLMERYLNSPCSVGDDERDHLYRMLPTSLKISVRSKLRSRWKKGEGEFGSWGDELLAEGWRDALKGIMQWLSPMAHDTVRWEAERNFERQNFQAKPKVLLLQTLHFSDREKTEAAIAEILVGVSCIFRYENRSFGSSSGSDDE